LIALWFTGYLAGGTYKMRKQKAQLKYIAAMALMLNLGIATVYAQRYPVKMAYSGTSTGASAVNLQQPGTVTIEENFAGNGELGPFTLRLISAETNSPQEPPSTCAGPANIYLLWGPARAYFASRMAVY
jgi:hypothetical protein